MNTYSLLLVLLIILNIMAFVSNHLLVSDTLYFNNFAEQLTYEQIENIILRNKEWGWSGYILLPLLILVKITLVASCISIGIIFLTINLPFRQIFRLVLEAEFIFLLPMLLKILWFLFIQTNYNLQDLQYFYPLSALHFFDYNTLQPWLLYPIQLLNVFEVLYWIVLSRGISKIIQRDLDKSFEVVLASYGTGLLFWVAVVMFITVSFSS